MLQAAFKSCRVCGSLLERAEDKAHDTAARPLAAGHVLCGNIAFESFMLHLCLCSDMAVSPDRHMR